MRIVTDSKRPEEPKDPAGVRAASQVTGKSEQEIMDIAASLHELNPMLGHRGCRLGITYPEITEMQARAIVEAALDALKQAPGLDVIDNPSKAEYPLPLYQAEKYNCAVGRLRKDCALDNGLCFWVSGDQLLKGAALNAVQIAEVLVERGWVHGA